MLEIQKYLNIFNQEPDTSTSDASVSCQRKQTRHGKLYAYRLKQNNYGDCLQREVTVDMPGILDIKWCPNMLEDSALVALVNSTGQLMLYRLCPSSVDKTSVCLEEVLTTELGSACLGLSLDWSNKLTNR